MEEDDAMMENIGGAIGGINHADREIAKARAK
jgi:hypothetical protein